MNINDQPDLLVSTLTNGYKAFLLSGSITIGVLGTNKIFSFTSSINSMYTFAWNLYFILGSGFINVH